jgi:hypothetical protein
MRENAEKEIIHTYENANQFSNPPSSPFFQWAESIMWILTFLILDLSSDHIHFLSIMCGKVHRRNNKII